ncbi:DUF3558 domain-containing protein [Saccharopolyspora hattusasensis]|uniref:DUF3558 domain-containing protein n=1 Tax=Saccharopolyspora hattusasensis TaxID=1128679 RepID=UPI003D987B4D
MQRRAALTALSLLAVLGVSACSPGGSDRDPTSAASEPPAAPTSAVPKVENPKNLKATTDACQLITKDQLSKLGAAGEGKTEQSMSEYGETQCFIRNDAFAINIAINTKYGGLAKIMEGANSSDNFKPTQVDGYQGARVDEQSTLCRVELAIADDQSIEINFSLRGGDTPEMKDPCGYAEKITSEVLKNIPDA